MTATEKRKSDRAEMRARWKAVKDSATAGEIAAAEAAIATHGLNVSSTGFILALRLMQEKGLDGIPYLDAKTFKGWQNSGFMVRKGEKSIGKGVTWIRCGKNNDEGEDSESFVIPRSYSLFHRSQVEAV